MFARASKTISEEIYALHGGTSDASFVEFGSGQGPALLNIYLQFLKNNFNPFILPTDIDDETEDQVKILFTNHNIKNIPWMKVNMEEEAMIKKVIEQASKKRSRYYTHNFISHEKKSILQSFLAITSKLDPSAKIIFTEFLLPTKKTKLDPSYPRYFEAEHIFSGQYLRGQDEILDIARRYQYKTYHTLVHHHVNEEPIVATFFLSK